MLYVPPEKWTEKMFDDLPFGEDDRYEFKSGEEISQQRLDDFCNKIAKEIGAFANSFGGTLFLGIADDKTKVGIPSQLRLKRGTKKIEQWLEQKISTLFDLRLQHFRISRLEKLSKNTEHQLGNDKTIIVIDVFDSELAPHQCLFDHRYYYRINSESKPAPHHYLSFLWGRANPNMSNVVRYWFNGYLNPIIKHLETVNNDYKFRFFSSEDQLIKNSNIYVRNIIFFHADSWDNLSVSLTAKQFLGTYPEVKDKLLNFRQLMQNFSEQYYELQKNIHESPHLENKIRTLFLERLQREKIDNANLYENKPIENILALFADSFFGHTVEGIGNFPIEFRDILARMTCYDLLKLEPTLSSSKIVFYNFCKDHLTNDLLEASPDLLEQQNKISNTIDEIINFSESLLLEMENLRFSLALKYNTTFE